VLSIESEILNEFKFSKVIKSIFEVGYCNFALLYIAYLLQRVFNSNIPCVRVMFCTVFTRADFVIHYFAK